MAATVLTNSNRHKNQPNTAGIKLKSKEALKNLNEAKEIRSKTWVVGYQNQGFQVFSTAL